uniref:Uncharacterized protein n=1 Tax=Amphimedon queenslandica TaxID=400682 RepID=A0A1X7SIB6_AMPQE
MITKYIHTSDKLFGNKRITLINPSITLVHYLDVSASGSCRKVTPASLKRQLTDQ